MNKEEITPATWAGLGFLQGLEGETKQKCADGFTKVTKYLLKNEQTLFSIKNNVPVSVLIYPIVRRLITTDNTIEINPETIITLVINSYNELLEQHPNLAKIDLEGEVCVRVCEEYLNKKEE